MPKEDHYRRKPWLSLRGVSKEVWEAQEDRKETRWNNQHKIKQDRASNVDPRFERVAMLADEMAEKLNDVTIPAFVRDNGQWVFVVTDIMRPVGRIEKKGGAPAVYRSIPKRYSGGAISSLIDESNDDGLPESYDDDRIRLKIRIRLPYGEARRGRKLVDLWALTLDGIEYWCRSKHRKSDDQASEILSEWLGRVRVLSGEESKLPIPIVNTNDDTDRREEELQRWRDAHKALGLSVFDLRWIINHRGVPRMQQTWADDGSIGRDIERLEALSDFLAATDPRQPHAASSDTVVASP